MRARRSVEKDTRGGGESPHAFGSQGLSGSGAGVACAERPVAQRSAPLRPRSVAMDAKPAEPPPPIVLPPTLQAAIKQLVPSEDPLDQPNFNSIEYINALFPTEQSLSDINDVISKLKQVRSYNVAAPPILRAESRKHRERDWASSARSERHHPPRPARRGVCEGLYPGPLH